MTGPHRAYFAWFSRVDWARWRAMDPSLQQSFDDWLRDAETLEQQIIASGVVLRRVPLDPEEFVAWCRAAGIEPDKRARMNFAVETGERLDLH